MCGINGWVAAPGERASAAPVELMNAELFHRGPDSGGVADLEFCAVGMRRLAIVDIEHGRQPMTSACGRYTLVYNGELYDADDERRSLEARGCTFRTRSDTEVLLQALVLDGAGALERLNGMFGFALVDREERSVLLARDPVGIKPLYTWVSARGELAFSSELGSLVAHPAVPRRIDRRSLAMLLHDRHVADPWTLFDGVHQLPPGHLMRWRDGKTTVERWHTLRFRPEPRSELEALAELRRRLDESVRSQLVADVPVGVFLSGGIDSSTVAAIAARSVREQTGEKVRTFSVGFARPEWDETELAARVARHIGSEHVTVRVPDDGFDPAFLDRVIDHVGQPLGDTSCIPTWIVSRAAREEVKVVLSGDGGDEFFGGYDHMFWAAAVRRVRDRAPALVRRVGERVLAGVGPVAPGRLAARARRARKGLALTFLEPEEQLRSLKALWSRDELAELLVDGPSVSDLRPLGDPVDGAGLEPEELAMNVFATTYLPGAILPKVDRMSMSVGLEVRVPLLDRRVVDFAMRLPLDLKIRGRTGKYLLREAGRPLLPPSLYDAPKRGFSIPLAGWLDESFWSMLRELYGPGSRAASLFASDAIERAIADGRSAGSNESRVSEYAAATRAWLLALLARWMDRYGVSA